MVDLVTSSTLEELPEWARMLLSQERVGHLGVIDAAGHPRVLPVTYAIYQGAVWSAVDNKPKRRPGEPARVRWLRERPKTALTVDRYDDDWSQLRWVQLLGETAVLDGPPTGAVLDALARRYPQYRTDPPPGPLLRLTAVRAIYWRAT
jgi:PPOX class probable F420-dependent enzyme